MRRALDRIVGLVLVVASLLWTLYAGPAALAMLKSAPTDGSPGGVLLVLYIGLALLAGIGLLLASRAGHLISLTYGLIFTALFLWMASVQGAIGPVLGTALVAPVGCLIYSLLRLVTSRAPERVVTVAEPARAVVAQPAPVVVPTQPAAAVVVPAQVVT